MIIIVTFRYLSGVILEARKVLSEALTAIEKQIDGSDTIFQNFTEHMTKTNQAIKKVSQLQLCCSRSEKKIGWTTRSSRPEAKVQSPSYR